MKFQNTIDYARQLDAEDPLKTFREKFYIPIINGKEAIYFTGNSLGLQPKTAQEKVLDILEDWANYGVEGHFSGRNPWVNYHDHLPPKLSKIVGALEEEIVVMNFLTVNLHLLFSTFYKPTKERYKIICEAKAFPSDQYVFESQAKLHGLNVEDVVIEVFPREGEKTLRTEDILSVINNHKDSVAIVLFSGVNYYTGQVFDMEEICKATHAVGAICGFDLAHAAGNVALELHDWDVDFAVWCNYKYLNAGPGAIGAAFINKKHAENTSLDRMAGWWGYEKDTRFKMEQGFKPIPTAEGWQLSTPPGILMSLLVSSLEIFSEASMERLIAKSNSMTSFLFEILDDINNQTGTKNIEIITPRDKRGCQVSISILERGKETFDELKKQGVICDWREPNVIRISPVPLYNTFEEIYMFGSIINQCLIK